MKLVIERLWVAMSWYPRNSLIITRLIKNRAKKVLAVQKTESFAQSEKTPRKITKKIMHDRHLVNVYWLLALAPM